MKIKDYLLWPRAYWDFKRDLKASPNWVRTTDNRRIVGATAAFTLMGVVGGLIFFGSLVIPFVRSAPLNILDIISLLVVCTFGGLMVYFGEGYIVRRLIKEFKF